MFNFKKKNKCKHCFHWIEGSSRIIEYPSDCKKVNPWTTESPNGYCGFPECVEFYKCCKCDSIKVEKRATLVTDNIPHIRYNEVEKYVQEVFKNNKE